MRKLIFILLMTLTISAFAQAQQHPAQNADDNKPIIVKADAPVVTVTLASNQTTGYSWFLESYDSNFVEPLSHTYKAPQQHKNKDTDISGAPGESIWTFRVSEKAFTVPRIIRITMIYSRPWELSEGRKKVITLITK